jgi:hypothetical protein
LWLAGLATVWTWLPIRCPGGGITRENYERIQVGMDQPEVEAIVGAAPGDYHKVDGIILDPYGGGTLMAAELYRMETWWGDKGILHVGFDDSGRVAFTHFADCDSFRQTLWGRLRHLLGV